MSYVCLRVSSKFSNARACPPFRRSDFLSGHSGQHARYTVRNRPTTQRGNKARHKLCETLNNKRQLYKIQSIGTLLNNFGQPRPGRPVERSFELLNRFRRIYTRDRGQQAFENRSEAWRQSDYPRAGRAQALSKLREQISPAS